MPVFDLLDFLKEILQDANLPVNLDVFIKLIELCVLDNVFTVNGKYYKQIFGFAMGNPLSPVLANIYMEFYETRMLPRIIHFDIIWYRYVDDILCLLPVNIDPNDLLRQLNELVPTIKFKLEVEENGQIPFLDTLVIKSNCGFKFKVYRKPTHVDAYIHYFSNHHSSIKKSVFSSMFLRALKVCDPEYLDTELQHINLVGKKLCYPESFINMAWIQARKTYYESGNKQPFNLSNILCLPYHRELEPISKTLKDLNINVVFKYESTIRNALVKNSPTIQNSPGVYCIPCKGCQHIYVGQSGKTLNERCKQHRYNVNTANQSNALFIHKRDNNHFIDWNGARIIYKTSSLIERLIVENILIQKCLTMNLNEGMYRLDDFITSKLIDDLKIKAALRICNDFRVVN